MNGMSPNEAIVLIESAAGPADLAAHDYRDLLKLVHPDRFPAAERGRADAAARKLAALKSDPGKTAAPLPKIGRWSITSPLAKGDVADLHLVTDGAIKAVLKIARSEDDYDLMAAEVEALKAMESDPTFRKYFPGHLDDLKVDDRRCVVMERADGYLPLAFLQSLDLDFRHIVWMGNRIWSALGYAHRCGYIHGAVLPQHLLYHPISHGLKLVDWTCSLNAASEKAIPYMAADSERYYPKEVLRRKVAESTDIFMAATCLKVASKEVPKRFRALFDWCTAESMAARPCDSWEVGDRWKALAEEQYGPAKYLKLEVPVQ